jgi:hypothetical protein
VRRPPSKKSVSGRDRQLLVVARLRHHVGESASLHRFDEAFALFQGHRSRDGAEDVLAGFQAFDGVRHVIGSRREQPDRFHGAVLQQFRERVVGLAAAVSFHQPRAPVRAQIAHRLHGAVGMLVKLERCAESAPDDTHPQFTVGRGCRSRHRQAELPAVHALTSTKTSAFQAAAARTSTFGLE